jgi:hypothetical protein
MRAFRWAIAAVLMLFASVAIAGEVNGVRAADAAQKRVVKGFTAVYTGQSAQTDTRPTVLIGYAPGGLLAIKVPMMDFHAVHTGGIIRVRSGDQGVVIKLKTVRDLTAEAEKGFVALSWLDLPDPSDSPMAPQLSFELSAQSLNAGIHFGETGDLFSWQAAMRSSKSKVFDEENTWRVKVDSGEQGTYEYLVSKETGLLTEMRDFKDDGLVRKMTLSDLKFEKPGPELTEAVFPNRIKAENFENSPEQKAQYLIELYDGLQKTVLDKTLGKWKSMGVEDRKALAAAVANYWSAVFTQVYESRKAHLEKAVADPGFAKIVKKRASNQAAFDTFKGSLPEAQQKEAKVLWVDRILGDVGYELLDPFVGWTRDRFIEPAKKRIDAEADKTGLDLKQREMLLATLGLPIIDAGYTTAEPSVLPKILSMIRESASGLQ